MDDRLIWTVYWDAVALGFGAVVGSFLNVVIARLPYDESVVSPRSRCPHCETPIAWYDNVPIVSWLILRAKCRTCKAPISALYPAVEGLTAGLSLLTFLRFVPDPAAVSAGHLATYLLYFAFVAGLVAVTFIDLEHRIIPDEISLGGTLVGLAGVASLDALGYGFVSWKASVLGAVVGGGSLLLVMGAYYLVRRVEGMGLGDVKLMAMLGAFLGLHPALLFILFVSSFLGSIIGVSMILLRGKDMQHAIPFGPFLAGAALLYLFWGWRLAPAFVGAYDGFAP